MELTNDEDAEELCKILQRHFVLGKRRPTWSKSPIFRGLQLALVQFVVGKKFWAARYVVVTAGRMQNSKDSSHTYKSLLDWVDVPWQLFGDYIRAIKPPQSVELMTFMKKTEDIWLEVLPGFRLQLAQYIAVLEMERKEVDRMQQALIF